MFDGKETSEDYRAQKQLVSRVMASYTAVANAFLVRMKACRGVHYFQKKYHLNKFENRVAVWIPQTEQEFKSDMKFALYVPFLDTEKPKEAKKPVGRPRKRPREEDPPPPHPN